MRLPRGIRQIPKRTSIASPKPPINLNGTVDLWYHFVGYRIVVALYRCYRIQYLCEHVDLRKCDGLQQEKSVYHVLPSVNSYAALPFFIIIPFFERWYNTSLALQRSSIGPQINNISLFYNIISASLNRIMLLRYVWNTEVELILSVRSWTQQMAALQKQR